MIEGLILKSKKVIMLAYISPWELFKEAWLNTFLSRKFLSERMEAQVHADEAQAFRKLGGWITFPFLGGGMLGLGVALSGATGNIIVYLIKEYNFKSIDAAQISNIINGCTSLAPLAGAIISDAYFGCFPVVAVSTIISFLATILFLLTATLRSLRPPPCDSSGPCEQPSAWQLAVLYTAVGLIAIGTGGTRFNNMTFGANQFDKLSDQDSFFNWYFVIFYLGAVIGSTVIVYIQDTVSWGLGFGICTVANAVGIVLLLAGARYYRRTAAQGSPFTGLARVVVAAVTKRRLALPVEGTDCYYVEEGEETSPCNVPSQGFRCLNRAALITAGDTDEKGSIQKPWRLTTVEQVEDFKTLLRISPLWSSSIFVSVSIGIQLSLSVLQALTIDRALSHHFTLPAGSVPVASLAIVIIALPLLDRLLFPFILKLTGRTPSSLQRIGVGHLLNVSGMAASALVERRRASIVHANGAADQSGWIVPMSVLWLLIPLALTGVGEAMHFPGQVALYYQEFPKSLKSTGTGMIALIVAIGFYMSTAVVDLVRKVTPWLPDNLNNSRLENVYWMLAIVGMINFGYYMVCANLYKYQSVDEKASAATSSN